MFSERYRSHHDAEAGLNQILEDNQGSVHSSKRPTAHPRGIPKETAGHGRISHPAGIPKTRGNGETKPGFLNLSNRLFHRKEKKAPKKGPPDLWGNVKTQLNGMEAGARRGGAIYIHVPFCDRICSFCNLNREKGQRDIIDSYTEYLLSEIEEMSNITYVRSEEFQEVYFGGGTPTFLSASALERVINAIRNRLPLSGDCEISMESTLHNLPPAKLAVLKDLGVNRLSIGIQTFSDKGRRMLERTGNRKYCLDSLEAIRANFNGILSLDIIYSYPGQSEQDLIDDAKNFVDLELDGTSFYPLMIHKGSSLAESLRNGTVEFCRTEETERKKHNLFISILEEAGYEVLELSKLVKPGRDDYRYIRLRYDNRTILPLGRGAGGRLGPYSVYNLAPGRRMTASVNPQFDSYHRILGQLQYGNYSIDQLTELTGPKAKSTTITALDIYRNQGFLRGKAGNERLSPDGIFWGNNIAVDYLKRIIKPGITPEIKKENIYA